MKCDKVLISRIVRRTIDLQKMPKLDLFRKYCEYHKMDFEVEKKKRSYLNTSREDFLEVLLCAEFQSEIVNGDFIGNTVLLGKTVMINGKEESGTKEA